MIPQRILIATDGSPAAKSAEALGADLAGLMSSARPVEVVVLTVVHDVGHVTPAGGLIPPSLETADAERMSAEGVDHIRSLLSTEARPHPVEVKAKVIESMTPGGGIVAEAHATGTCSMIILGNRGRGGLAEALLGSVSQHVVHEAHCPVMIARG